MPASRTGSVPMLLSAKTSSSGAHARLDIGGREPARGGPPFRAPMVRTGRPAPATLGVRSPSSTPSVRRPLTRSTDSQEGTGRRSTWTSTTVDVHFRDGLHAEVSDAHTQASSARATSACECAAVFPDLYQSVDTFHFDLGVHVDAVAESRWSDDPRVLALGTVQEPRQRSAEHSPRVAEHR